MAFCSKCGNQLGDGVRFCGACGQDSRAAGTAAQTASPKIEAMTVTATDLGKMIGIIQADPRFGNARMYDSCINSPVAVSPSGYIGVFQRQAGSIMEDYKALAPGYQPKGTLTILHISEVSSFELLEDQTSGAGAALGGAIVGGIFGFAGTGAVLGAFAGAGKSKQIDLKIVTSNFNHPQIIANLYKKAGGNSNVNKNLRALPERTRVSRIDTEIQELFSTLEGLLSRK